MITSSPPEVPAVSHPLAHVELPQSDEAERSVLGAVLVDEENLSSIVDILRPEDFYRSIHQSIFSAMLAMSDESEPIDLLMLSNRLRQMGRLDELPDGALYLSQLMDGIPRLMNVRFYARIVRERSVRRQLVKTANELVSEATAGEGDVEQVLSEAERKIFAIAEQRMSAEFATIKSLLSDSLDLIEARQRANTSITGVPTGFGDFDDLTSGLQPGDLILLAARPSMGKTALALSAAQNAAVRHGRRVAVFSLEMSALQLAMRMLFSEARVDMQKMRRGVLSDRHWSKLIKGYKRLNEAPIFLDDQSGITVTEMRAKARRLAANQGLDLVIVDYLQLINSSGRSENRQQEISAISRSLKEMARELNVPVLALSQLSRAPDQRTGDHRPHLSDLRESGSLEQDADIVAFIYREEVYLRREGKDPGDKEGLAELIVAKQRNGPVDTVKLAFIKEWTRFESLERASGGAHQPPAELAAAESPPEEERAPF
jgi:replicative DNA helicase